MACCRAKVTHVEHSGVEKIPIPGARFSHVHVDLVGPLPASRDGSTYLLTMVDRSTRWPEAVPLSRIDVETVLEACISTWVARFGVLGHITTDRGAQFTSGTWGDWCKKQRVQHITTTAYHPQANGMVEWIHRMQPCAPRHRRHLEGPPAMGAAGHAGCPQGGDGSIGGGGGTAAATGGAWSATAAQ